MNTHFSPSLGTLGALLLLSTGNLGCRQEAHARTTDALPPKAHVETTMVSERPVPKTLLLTGTIAADKRTELAANATGRIVRTFVERGERVERGQILAQLDARSAALSATQARANAESATASRESAALDCQRYEQLVSSGAITAQELTRVRTQCRTARASEEAARARASEAAQTVSDTTIRAPFAGTIAERFVTVGDYVRADSRVVTLLADDTLRVKLTIPEPYIGYVRDGLGVEFETVGLPGETFHAAVHYLGREVRSTTRDLVVEAVVVSPDKRLLPGMFASIKMPIGEATMPVVPSRAVLPNGTTPLVAVVEDGKVVRRAVQLGPSVGDLVAIRFGVAKGERIILDPNDHTPDGAFVE